MPRQYALGILPLWKRCPKCVQWLAYTDFWLSNQHPDGLHHTCRACMSHYESERTYKRALCRAERPTWDSQECSWCRITLPADHFTRDNRRRSGLYSYCKPCENARQRERRAAKKHQTR